MPAPRTRPLVLVVGLGGTIAMAGPAHGGVGPVLTAQQIVDAVPGLRDAGADLEVHHLRNRPGASLTPADLAETAALIRDRTAAGAAGAVVTQGTDTIEETAYVLDLLHTADHPVVVTGAMRNPTLPGADGPANVAGAVTVAASPDARGLGCLVVFADEIHAAARVRKTHSMSVGTFASPDGGPLGYLAEGRARIVNRPARRYTLPGAPHTRPATVALCTATLDDDGTLLRAAADRADGLVVAAFGVGHVPESWVPVLHEAASRIPVVLASRTGAGYVGTRTYGYAGSERDLVGRGLIPAGSLHPYKARLLLRMLLSTGLHPDRIRDEITAAGDALVRAYAT